MTRRHRIPAIRTGSTLFVLPEIPDDAPEEFKNGLAIRNACLTEGRCPACGAVGELSADPELERIFHFTFRHEDWCPVLRNDEAA